MLSAPYGVAKPLAIRHWSVDEGLPSSRVVALAKTPDGYLWVGTEGGLARFDGVRFVSYGESDGMPRVPILKLFSDPAGRLWAIDHSGELRIFYHCKPLPAEEVRRLSAGGSPALIGNDGMVYGTGGGLLKNLSRPETPPVPIPTSGSNSTTLLMVTRDGTPFATVGGPLWTLSEGRWQPWTPHPGDPSQTPALLEARDGAMWLSVGDNTICRIDPRGQKSLYPVDGIDAPSPFKNLTETSDGIVWIAGYDGGLWRLEGGRFRPVALTRDREPHPVRTLYAVDDGLWVGTSDSGLYRLGEATVESHRLDLGEGSDEVTALLEDGPGRFVVGTDGHNTLLWEHGRVRRYSADPALDRFLYGNALLRASDGSVWAGSGNGLHRFVDGELSSGAELQTPFDGGNSVLCLCELAPGRLYAGAADGTLHEVRDGELQAPPLQLGAAVHALARTADGDLWAATNGKGLVRVRGGEVRVFGRDSGLPSLHLQALHVDRQGRLWVGSSGGGIACRQGDRFISLHTDEGASDASVYQILDDGQSHLWLGGNRGISGLSFAEIDEYLAGRLERVHPVRLGTADGMASEQCRRMVPIRSSDGRLSFGTTRGFVSFDPQEVIAPQPLPRPVIEEFTVEGRQRSIDPTAPPMAIAPEARFEIRFTGLGGDLQHANTDRFRYRLAGLQEEWQEAGPQRLANFLRVPPGHYHFEVQAGSQQGGWNPETTRLPLWVKPHFWQTPWFLGGVGFAALAAVAGLVSTAERRRGARRLAELERIRAVESERSRIARDLHDGIGAALTQVGMLAAELNQPDPTEGDLHQRSVQLFQRIRSLARDLDATVWTTSPAHDRLSSLCNYLCEYAQEYFRPAGLHCRIELPNDLPEVTLPPQVRHHVFMTAREAMNNIVKHAGAREVRLAFHSKPALLTIAIRDDGRGFASSPQNGCNHGLANMAERMREVGGRCAIEPTEHGTTVTLELPLA